MGGWSWEEDGDGGGYGMRSAENIWKGWWLKGVLYMYR